MSEKELETTERKKYWLKLDKDYLKSPKIKVIEAMENGKDYIIFYLKLMLESVETVGHLRFTSLVPYNDQMLASITNTNIDIVRNATRLFCELGMMNIFEDGTIFMPEVPKMTGKESDSAARVRKFRERQKQEMLQCNADVTKCNDNINKEEDKEIKIEIKGEIDKDIKSTDKISTDLSTVEETGTNADLSSLKNKLETSADLFSFIQVAFGRTFNSIEYEFIETWENDDLTRYAIREAVLNQARSLKYVDSILRSWKEKGYQTIEDVKRANAYRKSLKTNKVQTDEKILEIFDLANNKNTFTTEEEEQEMKQLLEGMSR